MPAHPLQVRCRVAHPPKPRPVLTARSRAPAYDLSYYGYIPYPQLIAGTGARQFPAVGNG
jgi:hypothetical protein